MLRLNSLQNDYEFCVSCDPAFAPPPKRADFASDDEYTKAVDAYQAAWRVARETANYTPLILEGQAPTKFILTPKVNRHIWRAIQDRAMLPADSPRHIGQVTMMSLLVRLALKSIPAFDGDVSHAPDPQWNNWPLAPQSVVDMLEEEDPAIVGEIGMHVFTRLAEGLSSKR